RVKNHGAVPLDRSSEDELHTHYRLKQHTVTRMVDHVSNCCFVVDYTVFFNFSSHTCFQSYYRIYEDPIYGDFSPMDIVSIVNNYGKDWNKVSVWTQEFRISSVDDNNKISWLAGLFGFSKEDPVKQGT